MLITKIVEVRWNGANRKHYESLGYIFTNGGDKFIVPVEHLTLGSRFKVKYKCDYCGNEYGIEYKKYNIKLNKSETKKDCCKNCIGYKSNESFYDKNGFYIGKESIKKSLNTVKEKYGVDNINDIDGVREKHKNNGKKLIGVNNPHWKGGITPEEKSLRKIDGYKGWRFDVYQRDKFTCQCCKNKGIKLNAHHIINFSDNQDLRCNIDNGLTLCEKCHIEFHKQYGKRKNNEKQLKEFIANFEKSLTTIENIS